MPEARGMTATPHPVLTQAEMDQRVFDLHDEYRHGRMDRRGFLQRAAAVTAGELAMAQALLPRYAQAQTVSFTDLGAQLKAAVPFYGAAPETAGVAAIRAPLLVHHAEHDERVSAMWPAFEAALKARDVPYDMHVYPGTQHGFHNNSMPHYHEAAAKLTWDRTVAFFHRHLA